MCGGTTPTPNISSKATIISSWISASLRSSTRLPSSPVAIPTMLLVPRVGLLL